MRERGLKIALMCLGVAVAAYAGCGDGGTSSTSTGDSTSTGNGGNAPSTSSVTSGAPTTTTASGSTTTSGTTIDALGFACEADADCGAVLKCLTSATNVVALGNGGPANGYCSKDCKTDDDCPLSGVCAGAAGSKAGVCLLSCELGPKLQGLDEPLDPSKCDGREDARCATLNSTGTITGCRPTCGRDDQCTAGRVCDPRSALCVDKATTGLPTGAKCDTMAPECAGVCVSFGSGITMCSSPCGLGGEIVDLTSTADCGGLEKGICGYSPPNNGAGDYGFCAPSCKTHGDCQNPSFWCNDVGIPDIGYCFGSTKCPNGAADCKTPDVCTETKDGPFCLDPKFPLGTAAPGGTSSSSSTGSSTSTGTGAGGGTSTGTGSGTTSGAGGTTASASASTG